MKVWVLLNVDMMKAKPVLDKELDVLLEVPKLVIKVKAVCKNELVRKYLWKPGLVGKLVNLLIGLEGLDLVPLGA